MSARPPWPGPRSRLRAALFFTLGLLTWPACLWGINNTSLADRLVEPLLLPDTPGSADAIVVLSAGVTDACTPNGNSLRRALLGAKLFREGRAPRVVIAGGPPDGLPCSVAEVMAVVAETAGVPRSAMQIESASRTTWENAELSAPLLHGAGVRRILLVTDKLHMPRSEACFRRFNLEVERASVPVYESAGSNAAMLYWAAREALALQVYRWRGLIGASPFAPLREVAVVPPAPLPVANPGGPVVILGASYAGGWKVPSLAGIRVVTSGVAGQQSFEVLERFDRDVLTHAPRAVILWGYINDVFRSPREEIEVATERARESVSAMVRRARDHGIEPILATEVTIRHPKGVVSDLLMLAGSLLGRTSYQHYINGHVAALNDWLRASARREGLLLLDLQPVLASADGLRRSEYASHDGSHITREGYDALTAYAETALAAHYGRR